MTYIGTPNTESDAELKTRAIKYILNRICEKYKKEQNPTFDRQEVKDRLRGLGSQYVDPNIKGLFKGSGFIEIDDSYRLTLNESGRSSCIVGEL